MNVKIQAYTKSIAAALAALTTILAGFGIDPGQWGSSEAIGALASLIGTALVYFLPNKPAPGS